MSSTHIAIAIDGPAASGKSTLARHLAKRLGLTMINSGAMYRAITWRLLQLGVPLEDNAAVASALQKMDIRCDISGDQSSITIDSLDPTPHLREEAVNKKVSTVAAIPQVRERLVKLLRNYLSLTDVIMEGRDIGTVVFPDTPYKIYVDANPDVRQRRRQAEGQVDTIAQRDKMDSARSTAPLVVAHGAAILDNSTLGIEEGVEAALAILRKQGLNRE